MQTINVKTLPATNHKPTRVKATASGGATDRNRPSVTISKEDDNSYATAAIMLAKKLGWTGTLIEGGTKEGSVFVFADDKRHSIDGNYSRYSVKVKHDKGIVNLIVAAIDGEHAISIVKSAAGCPRSAIIGWQQLPPKGKRSPCPKNSGTPT